MTTGQVRAAVVGLSSLLALGCAALAAAHAGIDVGPLERIGPGGNRVVAPAAIAFTAATLLLAAVAVGASRRRAWSWALGVLLHALVFVGAALPYRGIASAAAMIVSATAVAVLVSRPGRSALVAR